jgi:hypothetical protein
MDIETKKAMLKTNIGVGNKLFNMSIWVSILLPVCKPETAEIWKALIPLGIVGLAISAWSGYKLHSDKYK